MTVSISAAQVRAVAAGIYVGNTLHAALPQTATQNLYTVSGGRILLVALLAEVTTVIQAQATTAKFTSTPTTGSAIDLCATADLNALQVGGRLTLPNPPASGTAGVLTNAGYTVLQPLRVVIPAGNISITTGASSTGALKYDLIYVPLDAAALVTAV